MARVLIIGPNGRLERLLVERLRDSPAVEACYGASWPEGNGFGDAIQNGLAGFVEAYGIDTVVYSPLKAGRKKAAPDLADAARVFQYCARAGIKHLVVLSSAAVYGPNCHNTGLMAESRLACRHRRNRIARQWWELEVLAERCLEKTGSTLKLTILRPAAVPLQEDLSPLGGLFHGWLTVTLPGHDPSIQLLSPLDLVLAIACAIEKRKGGVFNVAPDGVIPLRQALRLAGLRRLPISYLVQRAARSVLALLGLAYPGDRTEYLRYTWTISKDKIAEELGFIPEQSSAQALCDCRLLESGKLPRRREIAERRFDDYGFDPEYFALFHKTLAKFLEHHYWRVEVKAIENLPREGPAVLVGVHRGFMPFDGFIAAHLIARATGRIPRFLIHPGLVKFPFIHNFMTKQGGMIACNENADYVLKRDELLAIYPEGVHGAFRLYRDVYRLGKFGRDEYVRMALRHRAPIVPFVTIGSAEIFPILGKIEWSWWKRYSEWPFFPLTPTFPLLPVPLPSKWHTQFLVPLHVERDYPPEAADDDKIVQAIGREVRGRMEEAMLWMRGRRRSIFFGSIFGEEPASQGGVVHAGEPEATAVNVG